MAVDLPGGILFAVLVGADRNANYVDGIVSDHLIEHPQGGVPVTTEDWKANRRVIKQMKPAFELYPDEYPLLVRFRNINDPASAVEVTPSSVADQFGVGVQLRRITIAVEDKDGVTAGIIKRLPWLKDYRGHMLDGDTVQRSERLTNFLSGGAFTTEAW